METQVNNLFESIGVSAPTPVKKGTGELGQDEFLKLMLTQLRYQDPLKPVENAEFIAQTAQFSSVAGINAMRDSLDDFVQNQNNQQSLYSASLLGKTAFVKTSSFNIKGNDLVEFEYSLPHSVNAATAVFIDSTGSVVNKKSLGAQSGGISSISWNGSDQSGKQMPDGAYTIRVEYSNENGDTTAANVTVASSIDSVEFGTGGAGVSMSTNHSDGIKLSDISKITNG